MEGEPFGRQQFCQPMIALAETLLTKEEYIKELQFDLIMQTGIKHKPNIEVQDS